MEREKRKQRGAIEGELRVIRRRSFVFFRKENFFFVILPFCPVSLDEQSLFIVFSPCPLPSYFLSPSLFSLSSLSVSFPHLVIARYSSTSLLFLFLSK